MPGYEVVGKEELQAIKDVFDDGGILFAHSFDNMRNGRYRVRELEKAFAERIGVRYAQAVSSGSAALKIGLKAMGVKPGDEVITQAFTFVATVEAIIDCGAKPVLVNIDDTLGMDPAALKKAITRKTRVILPVHMLGVACEMDAISEVAKQHGIRVLEDNCQALGATWGDKMLGAQGDVAAFSLDFGKVITTGEGGIVATNDEEIFRYAFEYHDHGHMNNPAFPRGRDTHRIWGFNFRMTELGAAVGLAQLPKFDKLVTQNRAIWAVLRESLDGIKGLTFREIPKKCNPLCDCLMFLLPTKEIADAFYAKMKEAGLGDKNVPGAFEWHFAGYWDHIFPNYGMDKKKLWQHVLPSYEKLSRCIAIPVMVKYTPERAREIGAQLRQFALEVLG